MGTKFDISIGNGIVKFTEIDLRNENNDIYVHQKKWANHEKVEEGKIKLKLFMETMGTKRQNMKREMKENLKKSSIFLTRQAKYLDYSMEQKPFFNYPQRIRITGFQNIKLNREYKLMHELHFNHPYYKSVDNQYLLRWNPDASDWRIDHELREVQLNLGYAYGNHPTKKEYNPTDIVRWYGPNGNGGYKEVFNVKIEEVNPNKNITQ